MAFGKMFRFRQFTQKMPENGTFGQHFAPFHRHFSGMSLFSCHALVLRRRQSGDALERGHKRRSGLETDALADGLDGIVAIVLQVTHALAGFLDAVGVQEVVEVLLIVLVDDL